MRIRVVTIAGARPNFMKVAPIHRAMEAAGRFDLIFVHTGQHYDSAMSDVFLHELSVTTPHHELGVGSGTHAEQTANVMLRLEPILAESSPDVVIVVGDVNSTAGAAITAAKLGIPVAHVEAGLRSSDRTMPEEINRLLTDAISDLLFAPSPDAVENLRREGIAQDKIHFVGNVMIDSLNDLMVRARDSDILERLQLETGGFMVATLHRPSNVDTVSSLRRVADGLEAAARSFPVVFVAHPRTSRRLSEAGLSRALEQMGVRVIEPLGYVDFLRLESSAAGVLTDSGGVQEETTVLGVPCLTIRDTTERPVTVEQGTNELVGLDPDLIARSVKRIASGDWPAGRRPERWDGHTSERIVAVLERALGS